MASQIDPTLPADGVPAAKEVLRANLAAARTEIETLQSGKADLVSEIEVTGARIIAAGDLAKILVHTGPGSTWTLPALDRAGQIEVINDGSGPLALVADGLALLGDVAVAVGRSAAITYYGGGLKAKVVAEA